LRATCPVRPTNVDAPIWSARLDDLGVVDGTFVVTVLSRDAGVEKAAPRTLALRRRHLSAAAEPVGLGAPAEFAEGVLGDAHRPILAKLGVRGRTQAVTFAYESGVIRPGGE
jgi:hypothetical protein